jgi:hypothetical protein
MRNVTYLAQNTATLVELGLQKRNARVCKLMLVLCVGKIRIKSEQEINAPEYKCAQRSDQKVYKLRYLRKTEKKYLCCGTDKQRH